MNRRRLLCLDSRLKLKRASRPVTANRLAPRLDSEQAKRSAGRVDGSVVHIAHIGSPRPRRERRSPSSRSASPPGFRSLAPVDDKVSGGIPEAVPTFDISDSSNAPSTGEPIRGGMPQERVGPATGTINPIHVLGQIAAMYRSIRHNRAHRLTMTDLENLPTLTRSVFSFAVFLLDLPELEKRRRKTENMEGANQLLSINLFGLAWLDVKIEKPAGVRGRLFSLCLRRWQRGSVLTPQLGRSSPA